MTLLEISKEYEQAAEQLRQRIALLRRQLRQARQDPLLAWQLERRIGALRDIQRDVNETARITAHYYDREDRP